MKHVTIFTALAALLLLAGCGKDSDISGSLEFKHSGCAADTKGLSSGEPPVLYLRYTPQGLAIKRTNAQFSCIIKEHPEAIVCEVSVEGDDIYYRVHEWDGPVANCICDVEALSSTVTGLKTGKEYVLHYICEEEFIPISVPFNESLNLKLDLRDYSNFR